LVILILRLNRRREMPKGVVSLEFRKGGKREEWKGCANASGARGGGERRPQLVLYGGGERVQKEVGEVGREEGSMERILIPIVSRGEGG